MLTDEERRAKNAAHMREWYKRLKEDPEKFAAHRAKVNARQKARYDSDPEYRLRQSYNSAKARKEDPEKWKLYQQEWYQAHKIPKEEARNIRRLDSLYGMSPEQFQQMVDAQKGLCAICHRLPHPKRPRLNIDHCHETGKVRGLLCHLCNTGLGSFQDNSAVLAAAIQYLLKGK